MEKRENELYHVISACESTEDVDFTNIQNKRQAKMLCEGGEVFPALIGDIPYVKGQVSFFSTPRFRIDLTGWNPDDAWLHFFFYVSDPTAFTGYCQIELSSSGRCDVEEANWNSLGTLHAGWNEYILSFRDAGISGGVFDMSRVNWFRFYYYLTKDVTVGISRLEIITIPKAGFSACIGKALAEGEELTLSDVTGTVRASSSVLTLGIDTPQRGAELALTLTDRKNRTAAAAVSPAEAENGVLNVPLDTFAAAPGFSFPEIEKITLKAKSGNTALRSAALCGIETATEKEIEALLTCGPVTPENADTFVPAILAAKKLVNRTFEAVSAVPHRTANVWLPKYMAFSQLSRTAEEYEAAEGGVWVSPAALAADGSLSVTVKNRTGKSLSDLKLTLSAPRLVLGDRMPEAEVPFLPSEASAAVVLRPRPLAGGICEAEISVSNGEKKLGAVSRFLRFPGEGWYSGDLHTHSVRSDGNGTPAMNFYAAWSRGDSFLYMTDHNQKIGAKEDMKEGVSVLRANGIEDFEPLKGCEITVYGPSGHALSYNCATDHIAPPTKRTEADIERWNEIFTDIRKNGGLTFLAHPFCRWFNFPGMTTGVMADYKGDWNNEGWLNYRDGDFYTVSDAIPLYHDFHGIEIMNFDCYRAERHYILDPSLEYWDRMNLLGEGKFFGSSGTDGHDPADIARSKNWFSLPAPTPFFVNNALGNGSFYPSSGPLLRFTITAPDGTVTGMGGTSIARDGEERILRISAESAGAPISRVVLYRYRIAPGTENNLAAYENRNASELLDPASGSVSFFEKEITVNVVPGEFYRVEIQTEKFEEAAFSNPIWVSAGASRFGVREDRRLITLCPGESAMLFFDTDDAYDSTFLSSSSEAITAYDYGKLEAAPDALPGDYTVSVRTVSGKTDTVCVRVTA